MIYPSNFEQKIGFNTIRHEIEKRCISPLGLTHCQHMQFSTHFPTVSLWLNQTNEFLTIINSGAEFPLNFVFDMRATLKSATTPGTFLSVESMFNLQRSLNTISDVLKFFSSKGDESPLYPNLHKLVSEMQAFPAIADEISTILDKNGNLKDNASPLLADLRRTITQVTASINGILRRIIAQGKTDGLLDSDAQPSIRDGRLVLPVAPAHKRKIKGIVHDESASGKTVFIEPDEIVEANNRIRETEAEIAREIIRILTAVTDNIRPYIDDLLGTYDILGQIDFIRAKALFAHETGSQMPHLHNKPLIEWYHATHPTLFLSLREQGKEVVPLSLQLDSKQRILLISGPNAGGKSVCLKTVGIIQYMMQCGMLPMLYNNSHMGMFKSIFIDIGDQQSIEDDLSTYSSHLQNMKLFLNRGAGETLILIDEFGGGTEPQIGGAIAQAILQQLNHKKVYGVITTHYQNLKHFADETEGIVNGAMLYDRQHMRPLFQLSVGYPGSSFAIEIARKIGLPSDVIEQASSIVGSDYINMDKYLLDIVRDRKYWENKRHEIHIKEKKLDAIVEQYNSKLATIATTQKEIIKEARNEARSILDNSNAQIERTIREIREMQAEKEKTKEVRKHLDEFKQRLENDNGKTRDVEKLKLKPRRNNPNKPASKTTSTPDRPLEAGDNVVLKGTTTVGTIISVDEKYATVAFGMLKTRVETSKLERTIKKAEKKTTLSMSKEANNEIRARQLNFKPDIDIRGMRADEATQAITYFIDDAIQFNAKRVRILHGTGTGILKTVIRQYLDTVNGVKSYRDEHVQFGGAGITIVDLE
ncbi:MAG: Smr/MutS family protein [Bacteroidales bacterium]|nr:Smr/MutS family protein [Candidatus Sodaliphilus limicaballi]